MKRHGPVHPDIPGFPGPIVVAIRPGVQQVEERRKLGSPRPSDPRRLSRRASRASRLEDVRTFGSGRTKRRRLEIPVVPNAPWPHQATVRKYIQRPPRCLVKRLVADGNTRTFGYRATNWRNVSTSHIYRLMQKWLDVSGGRDATIRTRTCRKISIRG